MVARVCSASNFTSTIYHRVFLSTQASATIMAKQVLAVFAIMVTIWGSSTASVPGEYGLFKKIRDHSYYNRNEYHALPIFFSLFCKR